MKVMVIVKASQQSEAGVMPSRELLTAMGRFNEELVKAGVLLAGDGLHPSSKGARVRFSGASRTVIDGPFAETKELIAGYWLWKVKSLQEAIDWVKRCPNPHAEDCEVEIRPVFEADRRGFHPRTSRTGGAHRHGGGAEPSLTTISGQRRLSAKLSVCRHVHMAFKFGRRSNMMSSTTDRAEIEAVFQNLVKAHAEHDADAIVESYAPDAVIYDLAPPLRRRGMTRDNVAAWLAGWDGPIQIDARDVNLTVEGSLAFVSSLNRMRGRIGGEDQDMWYRTTMCLRKISGRWCIVCDHTSVPFYMDGSYRAAVDLKP